MNAVAEVSRGSPGARLVLVNPPPLRGRTNERTYSGGIGVSRKLKPFEREVVEVLPIDFLYLAAVAERAGAHALLLDLPLEQLRGERALRFCLARIEPLGPGAWVGVRLSMPSLEQDLAFADRLKAVLPGCTVFLFGTVIMASLDHWVGRTSADYVLFGDPEGFFAEVMAAADPHTVPGVVDPRTYQPLAGDELYDEAKVSARHAAWIQVKDLAALPRPAWHLLDLRRYAAGGAVPEMGIYLQASRGCPIACTMCPYALLEGRSWRSQEVARVVDEIAHLNQEYGIHRVRFRDPNFGFSRRYARELAEALIARGVRLSAAVETSVEVLDEETLRKLRQAGIDTITTGVESDDAACLQSIGQSIKVNARLRERLDLCHRLGFRLYGTFCLGTPEETWDTVEKTWRFARVLDIESGFTVMTPFPGTPMYWRALREGLLPRRMQFTRWNSYESTVRTYALSTRDLDMARWWARMETILPFRRRRAAAAGRGALLRFTVRHLPHYAWLAACRAYVAFRRRFPAARRDPAAGHAPVQTP
jgi:anaerobic magnesium-protoporphyrin IX monomethyl ester cyclase